jgi:hypothetical protein
MDIGSSGRTQSHSKPTFARLAAHALSAAALMFAGGGLVPAVAAAEVAQPVVGPQFAARITFDGLVPYQPSREAIVDDKGRTRVIVDFMNDAQDQYLQSAIDDIKRFVPGRDRHNPLALRLIEDYERRFGIEPVYSTNAKGMRERSNITTWVGASFTAYLTPEQIDALRRDKNVRLVTQDGPIKFSGPQSSPPWYQSWNGAPWTELNDWGWNAVQGKSRLPGSTRKVYIIDSGVALHSDLGSVIDRRNVVSPNDPGAKYLVDCYTHATHVAGIIGATEFNGSNRRGVYAGADMVSLAIGSDVTNFNLPCNTGQSSAVSAIGIALDTVVSEGIAMSGSPQLKPHIVNLSANLGSATGFDASGVAGTNQQKIVSLITPRWVLPPMWSPLRHPGHVFVQSAGNQYENVCSDTVSKVFKTASNATSTLADGAIVVGAINNEGKPVGGTNGAFKNAYPSFSDGSGPILFGEPGSNYGPCVDMWAPGDAIYSTWGVGRLSTLPSVSYSGGQPSSCASGTCVSLPHQGWAWLSGTSMAAPHVAAAAAYVADLFGLTTPAAIEQKLREMWQPLTTIDEAGETVPRLDAAGAPMRMVHLN